MDRDRSASWVHALLPVLVLGAIFAGTSSLAQANAEFLKAFVADAGPYGIALYALLSALAVVAAPLSAMPLLPLASMAWGPLAAALASIVGWHLGAVIAFSLSRRFGRALAERVVPRARLESLERMLPQDRLFWRIAFLQMTLPVDVLSYTLGLFPRIPYRVFVPATLLGVSPFAFVFAYLGALPFAYQAGAAVAGGLAVLLWFLRERKEPGVGRAP